MISDVQCVSKYYDIRDPSRYNTATYAGILIYQKILTNELSPKYSHRDRVFDKIFSLDQIGSSQAMSEPLYF